MQKEKAETSRAHPTKEKAVRRSPHGLTPFAKKETAGPLDDDPTVLVSSTPLRQAHPPQEVSHHQFPNDAIAVCFSLTSSIVLSFTGIQEKCQANFCCSRRSCPDRGRDGALVCATPPSEPDVRISRIRLSGRWFLPHEDWSKARWASSRLKSPAARK
jgi:hypothetical protein